MAENALTSGGGIHHRFAVGDGFVVVVDEWETAGHFEKFFADPDLQALIAVSGGPPGLPEVTIAEAITSLATKMSFDPSLSGASASALTPTSRRSRRYTRRSAAAISPRSWTRSPMMLTGGLRRLAGLHALVRAGRYGKDAFAVSLAALGLTMEVDKFRHAFFPANQTDVLTVVRFLVNWSCTGKTAAMDLHHLFRFRDGEIADHRGTEDTAQTVTVLRD